VLAGDAQSGAVLHQAHIMNVGYLGAVSTLVDPAHDTTHELGHSERILFMIEQSPITRDSASVR